MSTFWILRTLNVQLLQSVLLLFLWQQIYSSDRCRTFIQLFTIKFELKFLEKVTYLIMIWTWTLEHSFAHARFWDCTHRILFTFTVAFSINTIWEITHSFFSNVILLFQYQTQNTYLEAAQRERERKKGIVSTNENLKNANDRIVT